MICLSVFAEDYQLASAAIDRYGKAVSIAEIRLDRADIETAEKAISAIPRPLVLTCRPEGQGGFYSGTESQRLEFLRTVIRYRPLYIDVEMATASEQLITDYPDQPFILSYHDGAGTPSGLRKIAAAAAARNAAVIKIVTRAERCEDNLAVLEISELLKEKGQTYILFCMGELGIYSRAVAGAYGSIITYCSPDEAEPTGAGQFRLSDAIEMYQPHKIKKNWSVYGIVGNPVGHSLSPKLHNRLFADRNIKAIYLPFKVEDFAEFIKFADKAGIVGLSVTSPHKTAAASFAVPRDVVVRMAAAANTLKREENKTDQDMRYEAYNTDGPAFIETLQRQVGELKGKRITVAGIGGAARAIAYSLIREGAELTITARKKTEARELALALGCRSGFGSEAVVGADVAVNATSIASAAEDRNGFLSRLIPYGAVALDLNYTPPEPYFLKEAALRGCRTINGLDMFLRQAALQFEIWTGTEPQLEEMQRAIYETT